MFNVVLDYPSFEQEVQIVKNTTSNNQINLSSIISSEEIINYQNIIRKIPVNNVLEYVVSLVNKTRPKPMKTNNNMEQYIEG